MVPRTHSRAGKSLEDMGEIFGDVQTVFRVDVKSSEKEKA